MVNVYEVGGRLGVVLTVSVDIAVVVEYYEGRPDQEPGYELEVFNAVGKTIAVVTVRESQIESLRGDEILCVRPRGRIAT